MERTVPISEAARALGVSLDTLRRWERSGRLRTGRDDRNRRVIPESEITRLGGRTPSETGTGLSARNRFDGVVTAVEVSGVMALVEIQAGPHRIVSLMTAEAVDELDLKVGDEAVCVVKSTNVIVEIPSSKESRG